MFDKLKRKLILINMLLLTTVFIGIFGSVYLTNVIRNNNEMEMTLYKLIRGQIKDGPGDRNFFSSIIIDLDEDKKVMGGFSNQDIADDEFEKISQSVLENSNNLGNITVNNERYKYLKQETSFGTRIAMVSREQEIEMMIKLLESFIIMGAVSLVALLIISVYLTNKTIKPIKETFEKQKQFIADASHELRTPLTIINTNTSLILSNPEDTVGNQSKWLKYITLQSDRMSELINEMLSLAKMDTDENQMPVEDLNMSKVIESMILSFEAVIFEKGLVLQTDILKGVYIKGHIDSIKKVFSILMDNAIKYSGENGEINVELKVDKNKVKLKVKNTGDGVSEEHLEKIFERFYRVDSSRDRETGGYGLGLSIAKSIAAQHKGKIYAKSDVGKDTTFVLEIPISN